MAAVQGAPWAAGTRPVRFGDNFGSSFEELRYPDSLIENDARIMVGIVGAPQPAKSEQIIPTPSYELYLSEIDPLVRSIIEAASVNPAFFLAGMNHRAREYFSEGNLPTWAV